jgi:hypothetical protein
LHLKTLFGNWMIGQFKRMPNVILYSDAFATYPHVWDSSRVTSELISWTVMTVIKYCDSHHIMTDASYSISAVLLPLWELCIMPW